MKDSQSIFPDTNNIDKIIKNKNGEPTDLLHEKTIELIFNEGLKVVKVSTIQHHFRIGYNRAANILEKIRESN
ncbi:Ftsk gamma domain [Yersinia mollaretii]|uniref:DNA translocase FtsK n=1 Tax=Yersinia mollaretii TaxID=33060 RepID=UPI0005E06B59|nr:DNA translocase FtsK [Yersinia mollaretii]CQJ07802.1 Ftsk gamma domain [Yersinia mollaretii]